MAVPSWDVIRHLALELEVQVEQEEDGWIRIHKYDSIDGIFQDSEAGRREALAVIEQHRRVMEESDAYRAKK